MYVWMPSACHLGDLKIVHVPIKDPGRIVRSCGERRNVRSQRNKGEKTINSAGMTGCTRGQSY